MSTAGEMIVGEWLHHVCGCAFVQYDVPIPGVQGDIDVVGIDTSSRTIYLCEVSTHLRTGIRYTRHSKEDNVSRFLAKFEKDIQFAKEGFPDYHQQFMLWSPIVKKSRNPATDQIAQLEQVRHSISSRFGEEIQLVINEGFLECIDELRAVARAKTSALNSPIMRLMQIEEALKRTCGRKAVE